jgi:hypothetical protein
MKMKFLRMSSAVALTVSVATCTLALSANAQTGDTTSGETKAQIRAEHRAERKAARKEARAKNNAELKKLEAAGYDPAKNDDTTYPEDIQKAERKAAAMQ